VGAWVGGLAPQPPTPNPQSPIPNPHKTYIKKNFKLLIKFDSLKM